METKSNIGCLFDLDGVLIDSESLYTKIWEAIEKQWPTGVDNFAYKIKGTTLEDILDHYFPEEKVRSEVVKELYRLEALMIYAPLPGAVELLDALRSRGVPVAMVTSSNDLKMKHLWSDMPELKEKFDVVITGDEVTHSKPDPEGYLMAARRLGLDHGNYIVFEDSLQGVKAGKAAGAFVVGVAGTLRAEDIAPYSDIVVNGVAEVNIDSLLSEVRKRIAGHE